MSEQTKKTILNSKNSKSLKMSLQTKFIMIFVFIILFIVNINLVIYFQVKGAVFKIADFYLTNTDLNSMQSYLGKLQADVVHYQNTLSEELLKRIETNKEDLLTYNKKMNETIVDNEMLLTEKNVKRMVESYLMLLDKLMEDKRQDNIISYRNHYEEIDSLYNYLNTIINSLNNTKFKANSKNYMQALGLVKKIESVYFPLLIFVIIFNISILLLFLRKITRPLKKLASNARAISGGDLNPNPLPEISYDEIGVLTNAFNQMVLRVNLHIQQVKASLEREASLQAQELQMEAELKEARYKNLQAQINPHFLFNTLNAGAQLAMLEEAERSYTYLQRVADFYRYNIRLDQTEVLLEEEIKLVDDYIYIVNVRFADEIVFFKNITGPIPKIKMPWMTLQPIVENSVKYCALFHEQNFGQETIENKIELSLRETFDQIIIRIKDNGPGISQEKIAGILATDKEASSKVQDEAEKKAGETKVEPIAWSESNGVGLRNIVKRLRLYYKSDDIITIESAGFGLGTAVNIKIPKQKIE